MKLINADDVKEMLESYRYHSFNLDDALHVIDKAPEVEPFEPDYVGAERLKARQRGYEAGYHEGMEIGKKLKPKGEWIYLGDNPNPNHKWSCSHCGRGVKDQERFCPNCGYTMKGGIK